MNLNLSLEFRVIIIAFCTSSEVKGLENILKADYALHSDTQQHVHVNMPKYEEGTFSFKELKKKRRLDIG